MDDQNVPHEVDPTCSTPSRIGSRSFSNLKLEEFACPPELLLAPRYVEATAGKATLRKCVAFVSGDLMLIFFEIVSPLLEISLFH